MPPKDKVIEPINASMDDVVEKLMQPVGGKPMNIKRLDKELSSEPALGHQYVLEIDVEVEKVVNGIEMGVLGNGIPYLTQNGLAGICGVAKSVIYDISKDWEEHYNDDVFTKDRISFIRNYLFEKGYTEPKLYIEVKDNTTSPPTSHYSYPDIVCMAVLEFYAFESKSKNQTAVENYRKLATYGLQKYIYDALGYQIEDKWKFHNERQSILRNSVPAGYFSVFHEINPLTLDLIHANLPVNEKTVPDISVGQAWATHWKTISHKHSERIPYPHDYPDSYKQSQANGYIEAKAYPDTALPEFRRWFREAYLTTKFPKYILTKANVLTGGMEQAKKIAATFKPKQLPKK